MDRLSRMKSSIQDVWLLERDLVSEGFDSALERLKQDLPITIHEYPSGSEVWTWIIPQKWICRTAYLERMDGERLLDRKDHPLHCASYSASFEGIVTREMLFAHLQVHPNCKDAIPYAWKHYKQDWGLCCSAKFKAGLMDDRYRVVIETEETEGMLKVGEVVVYGELNSEFVLCAHLCHPCQVNDGLSGVVAGLEVMQHLAEGRRPRNTYRLLITPETIGSIAWMSHHEQLLPNIKGGLFLEMLGTDCPHALQMSFDGNTEVDNCILDALVDLDPDSWSGPFRQVIGNDERQWNAPGVRIPMLSLSRVFHPTTGKWPFPEYHSSLDTPERMSWDRLNASVDVVIGLIERLEENAYPMNLFRGEVFCSRFGIHIDYYEDQAGNRRLFDVLQMIDGTKTVNQIARSCGLTFMQVLQIVEQLEGQGLVKRTPSAVNSDTHLFKLNNARER